MKERRNPKGEGNKLSCEPFYLHGVGEIKPAGGNIGEIKSDEKTLTEKGHHRL